MSLRVRLNILITTLFTTVFIGAGIYVINNSRDAVKHEIDASARHTLQLIEVLLNGIDYSGQLGVQDVLIEELSRLDSTRHLQISIRRIAGDGQATLSWKEPSINSPAPQWFINLVESEPVKFKRIINMRETADIEITVHANPADEITEAWYETRSVLFFLLLFITLANLLVYFVLGRYLAPVESILQGLERIEQGDYHSRLPACELPELSRISVKFNHMADVLLQSREQNRRLAHKTLVIQEQERRNLARELHDELGQSLSAIKAVAVSIEQKTAGKENSIAENARAIRSFSERMYEVAHSMMQRLRPVVLDELGLLTSLQVMIDDWNKLHSDCFCHFDCNDDLLGLGEELNINLYRIIQESLTNTVKHSRADEMHITIVRHTDQLSLLISDNGRGFEVQGTQWGLGLAGIGERVEALGGVFQMKSGIGQGAKLDIILPLSGNNQSTGDLT